MYKKLDSRVLTGCVLPALILLCSVASALDSPWHTEKLVTVKGDFDDKLIQIALDHAEACFNSLNETYFQTEPEKPLNIYLARTAAESRKLIEGHGRAIETDNGFYLPSVPAVYTYITNSDGNITFEPLYASIAEHFMFRQFDGAPEWFRSSLVSFLSKRAQIINGKLVPAGPCPRAGLALRAEVEADTRLNIKKLYISSDERYRQWQCGPYLAKALLCWLYQNGHLADYVRMVQKKGYELEVLEEATGASAGKINIDLKRYIEGDYCTAAYLAEAEEAQDPNEKENIIQTALKKKPDYPDAQMALARLYYSQGKYQLCYNSLTTILDRPENIQYMDATRLAAAAMYEQSNYAQARDYYQQVWEKADNYVYKYQIAYKIAGCSHYLNEPQVAAHWYNQFLELDFWPDKDQAAVSYAKEYVEAFGNGSED